MSVNWKNKKVLVTGADGFIGSHLTEQLVKKGAKVRAFVYYNSFNSWGWLDHFPKDTLKKIEIFTGDIRDSNGVLKATKGIDVIFHLAALIGIPFSFHSPDSYVDTNVKGTLNILQAAQKRKVEKIIHTSTSEVYGTAQYVPITERHPINPQSPYAATKAAADHLALSFYHSFNLPVVILRPFNTFGPRQSARAIIPTILTQVATGKRTVRLGNIETTRDFNYISNTIDAFMTIVKHNKALGRVFNVATDREISIKDLVHLVEKLTNKSIRITIEEERLRPAQSEVEKLHGDATKIKKVAGWSPKVSLEEGLTETFYWIKKNIKQYKPDIYNV